MIEAKITVNSPCDIPDLGLFGLKRGQTCWVDDLKAKNSRDLERQRNMGAVRVARQTRRKMAAPRNPPPPFVAQSRPQVKPAPEPVVEKHVETVIEKTVVEQVDTEKLRAEILGDLLPGIRAVIAEEVGKAQAPAPQGGIDASQLEDVLESVLRRVAPAGGVAAAPSGGSRRSSGPEEPVFIPDQILSKDAQAKIDVKQKATEGGSDLDEAEAALRALKRKKRGRKKKESDS